MLEDGGDYSLADEMARKIIGIEELFNTDPPEEQARELVVVELTADQWQHEVDEGEVIGADILQTTHNDVISLP